MKSWLTSSVEDRESFYSRDDMGSTELSSSCCTQIDLPLGFSGNLSRFLKAVKKLVLYDFDRGVVMEPMQGKLASSQIDFGYNEQFRIPG